MIAKDCPFCGMKNNLDIDTLYPSGTGWKEEQLSDGNTIRYYVSAYDVPKEQWCYKVVCNESYGGCGAEIHGDSIDEVIDKWNTRPEVKNAEIS